ncbi:MAG: DMT family transporter [Alphaproteobacteria bacterium]|nr:DMT family transporter [Alphaproteobacteria bacterium]
MSPWLLVPLAVGLAQPVIWQMNLRVAEKTGVMESAIVLHVIGTAIGLGWFLGGVRGAGFGGLGAVPWWAWAAGALGVSGMAAMNRAIPEIGVATALALTVAAQLSFALVFEHYGLLGAEVRPAMLGRWVGVGLLAVGAWLVTR